MAQSTQTYKRSLSGSVGAGLNSIFGNGGKTYYVLEHKVSSKYHKAGEAQEIIVDQIELGRDSKCAVQFDESFKTVSRQHAAIVRDGQNWKLIQLSHTNKTFLNGHAVEKEWYLQNGDEIQLSVNGPKLGFIIPSGNKSTVGSIGFSRRLSLFRQQALRPYKTAMSVMASLIILLICGGIGMGIFYNKKLSNMDDLLGRYRDNMSGIVAQNEELARMLAQQDSINKAMERRYKDLQKKQAAASPHIAAMIDNVKSDVFYIETVEYVTDGKSLSDPIGGSTGTGFLLEDGRFVTARHCVQTWRCPSSLEQALAYGYIASQGWRMTTIITAYGPNGKQFEFSDTNFKMNDSQDEKVKVKDDEGHAFTIDVLSASATDWAYATTDIHHNQLRKGKIKCDQNISSRLHAGTEVHVLGFPEGIGYKDGSNNKAAEAIYNSMKVARDGLNGNGMIMMSQGVAHGNSGGPLFIVENGSLYAIGIVSQLMMETQRLNRNTGALMQQQQQYEEHVPIRNIY